MRCQPHLLETDDEDFDDDDDYDEEEDAEDEDEEEPEEGTWQVGAWPGRSLDNSATKSL